MLPAWASLRWPSVFEFLALDRGAVRAGEAWRLWSGHLAHLDVRHAALNLIALAVLAGIALRIRQLPALLGASLVLMPAISLGLLLAVPGLQWYVGLSGLLHGWAAWLLVRLGGWIAATGFLLFAVKLSWERWAPADEAIAIPVVTEAHLIGALAGLVLASAWWRLRKQPSPAA